MVEASIDWGRFEARYVVDPTSCWLWFGALNKPNGYGVFKISGRQKLAHVFAYECLFGPVPPGLELDHLCRTRRCVNPDHLEAVTHTENMRRGAHTLKTHCPRGHEYSLSNTYWSPAKARNRLCRTCQRMHKAAYKARKRAA